MDCLDAKQKLEPCARGELGSAEKAELYLHVATCEGCRLELELTRAVMGSSSADPPLDTIEMERVPPPVPDGPPPARVLTSQLPAEPEDSLDLAGIQPTNAYDPGAIDLPHTEPSPHFGEEGPGAGGSLGGSQFHSTPGGVSFDDLMESTAPVGESTAPASTGAPGSGSARSSASGRSWDFEPVDVPRSSAPPEESLTFAKEALDRKRGKALRGKAGARLLLWVGGAVGGVGLLGASVWMALAFLETPSGMDPNLPAVQPPPGAEELMPPATTDSAVVDPQPDPGLTATDSSSSVAPSFLKAGAAGTPGVGQPGTGSRAQASTTKGQDQARVPGSDAASTKAAPTQDPTPSGTVAPSVTFRHDELAPAPRRAPPILTVERDAVPGSDPVDEGTDEPADPKPTRSVSTAPIFVPPSSDTPRPSGGASAGTSAEQLAPTGPIGRLHLATVTAQKNGDLEALRTLKGSWRSMIRTMTGTDRARAKREYADCLWAIQEITKRDTDRKEALTAYRDYVLYAPAGGADARTVSRMRHLEDILSDPQ
jgi:hypothetical protein